ncbi:hypothetical protein U9M48_018379, partial [Paspalum notatum var. saurae]
IRENTCPKRRNTGQKDVKNHPSTPYVSLCPIVPFQNLRSNIIRASHKILESLPCIIQDGEAKVRGLERRVLLVAEEEEVLWLEIPVEDPHGVAAVHDGDDLAAERCGGALGVVAPGDDAVEELPALAELHDEVDGVSVLVCAAELDDVAVAREVVHDLHLPAHVLDVVAVDELAGGDGLAGEAPPRVAVRDEVGDPELAPPQLAPEGVGRAHVLHRPPQHAPHRRRRRRRRLRLRRRALLVLLRLMRLRRRRRRLGLGLGRGRRGRLLVGGGLAVVARGAVTHVCLPAACAELGSDERKGGEEEMTQGLP